MVNKKDTATAILLVVDQPSELSMAFPNEIDN